MGSARRKRGQSQRDDKSFSASEISSVQKSRTAALGLTLILCTFAAYSSIVRNSFVNFDDNKYILGTPEIKQSFGWNLIRWAFTTFSQANWHPLTWLSHSFDYRLFESSSAAVHIENVLLHAAAALILFLALKDATGARWRSLSVAALFALHPLNVESVAWAAERKSVLSMLFFALALWSYGRYARRPTIGSYAGAIVACALGLMAKPQIVTLPFALLLWDIWPLNRWPTHNRAEVRNSPSFARLVLEKTPLFLLSAASSLITLRAQTAGGAVHSFDEYPFSLRLGNALVSYARYLGKAIWSFHLAVFYPDPVKNLDAGTITLSVVVLLAISTLVWFERKRRYLVVGWLWFLGTLVPMIGLVQVGEAAMADRYAYIPAIGLFLMAVWGVADWASHHDISKYWLGATVGLVLTLFASLTYRQVGYWHDSETLWTHTLEVTGDNSVAHDNLGAELVRRGQREQAIEQFRQSVAIHPEDWLANLYLGVYQREHGNYREAIQHLQVAADRANEIVWKEDAHSNLGTAYRSLHEYPQARENFQAVLRIDSGNSIALISMGLMAQREGNFREAIHWYSQAMLKQPTAVTSLLLANAAEKDGRHEESQIAYERAKGLTQDLAASQRIVNQMLAQ